MSIPRRRPASQRLRPYGVVDAGPVRRRLLAALYLLLVMINSALAVILVGGTIFVLLRVWGFFADL